MNKYCLAYGLYVFIAVPITFGWSYLLHRFVQSARIPRDENAERILWLPILTGMFERALVTTLVGWSVSGAAGFIGAWVAVKAAGGWSSWNKGTTHGRAIFSVGLLGSALSISFGLLGGLLIATSTI